MPSNPPLDPFRRFRLRSNTQLPPPSSSEEDSDESSPDHDTPRVIHIPAPKHPRKSGERLVSIPDNGKISRGAPENLSERAHIALSFGKSPDANHPERPSKKPSKSGVASDSVHPSAKSTLLRRVTSKLNISIPLKSASDGLRSRPSTRTLPLDMRPPRPPPLHRATAPASSSLPNSFISKEHREAALRERGLLPPRKDLSEQERDADKRLDSVPLPPAMTSGGSTEAEQLKASWLAMNRISESSDSDCGPPTPPYLGTGPQSMPSSAPPPDANVLRRSVEDNADLPSAGRPSFCSSLPPLSTSYLEVVHEDPSEQGPLTPPPPLSPTRVQIFVSSPLDYPSSPIIVESPVSCTFSSHCPGSTLESQPQSVSDHPSVPEKENMRLPASRRGASDSDHRPRKVVGPSLSKLGTRSLSNLRRSVAESLGRASTSTHSSADLPNSTVQVPRTAISPTIHSLGSILRETRDIEDAESRRLSELAFLD